MESHKTPIIQLSRTSLVHFPSIFLEKHDGYYLVKTIHLTSTYFPYIYCVISILLCFFKIIAYSTRNNKFILKYIFPIGTLAYQIDFLTFSFSNLSFTKHLIQNSKFNCKIITFINHVSSTWLAFIFASSPNLVRLYLNQSFNKLDNAKLVLCCLPLIISIVYCIELFYLDIINIDIESMLAVNITNSTAFKICGIKNTNILIIRDLLDFVVYFMVPFCCLIFILYELKQLKMEMYPRMRIILPVLFVILYCPIISVTLLRDFQLLTGTKSFYLVELVFNFTIVVNRSFIFVSYILDLYFNEHSRKIWKKLICSICFKFKIKIEFNDLFLKNVRKNGANKLNELDNNHPSNLILKEFERN